jgi:hypothetical protein
MVEEILREDLVRKGKYRIEFHDCSATELVERVGLLKPDIVISTAQVRQEDVENWRKEGIHFFRGVPFISGQGSQALMAEVRALLDTLDPKAAIE